ncbi:MAG: hypothetical protein IJG84_25515 [Kiritimatiellae bacterium]|nr:hypothetical protein [Kiritimatiellia bacterium]
MRQLQNLANSVGRAVPSPPRRVGDNALYQVWQLPQRKCGGRWAGWMASCRVGAAKGRREPMLQKGDSTF